MIYRILPLVLFVLFAFNTNPTTPKINNKSSLNPIVEVVSSDASSIAYFDLKTNGFERPDQRSFITALEGFHQLKEVGKINKDILTLIDFSLSSTQKRLWVIDVKNNIILSHSLVAHGKNSGFEYASKFSNTPNSYTSSLGFYATGETYFGKHGYSLRLDGLEKGVNDNARKRAIVIHGANYVSKDFIDSYGRLGRSFGCPALPQDESKDIIDLIKERSCLYIYYPSEK